MPQGGTSQATKHCPLLEGNPDHVNSIGSWTQPLHLLPLFSWDGQKLRLKSLQKDCARAEVPQSTHSLALP